MKFGFLKDYYFYFIYGTENTLLLAFFSVVFGVILGIFFALMRLSKNKILKRISASYIAFIRGTPSLIQVMIVVYGITFTGIKIPDFISGIIALSINSSAYVAEIIRAGIQSVDKGQMEAAGSLGLNRNLAMRYVIIPQAVKNILPALGNEFITVIKESSIVMVVGIHELSYNTQTIVGDTFRPFEPLIVSALIYFVLTFSLSKLMNIFERSLRKSD